MRKFWLTAAICFSWIYLSHALELRGPYLADLQPDKAVVICHTSAETELELEYSEEAGGGSSLKLHSQKSMQHVFHLMDLKPNSRYSYRIVCADETLKRSELSCESKVFTTSANLAGQFSFIAYGDSRDGTPNPTRHRRIATNFLKHSPAFVVSTGDLLIGGEFASQSMFSRDWTLNFFLPLTGVFETIPYHLTIGNHDQDSPAAVDGVLKAFPRLNPSTHYGFRYGNTHFVILHVADRLREFQTQKQWFVEELKKASDADWRIVFLHVSPFTNGKYRNMSWTLDGRKDFLETCVETGVDLVISGHDHSYQRFHQLRSDAGDKHSVLFVVTALAGTNPYPASEDDYTAKVVNKTDHFCVVNVNPEKLTITAYDNKNIAFDTVEIPQIGRDLGKVWPFALEWAGGEKR